MACEGGNWFKPSINSIFGKFNNMGKLKRSVIEKSILSDLVLEMLYFLRTEINESDLIYSHFLDPIRYSIYGLDGNGISPAQHWLFVYVNQGQDMFKVVNRILESSTKSTNLWYDPVINEPVKLSQLTDVEGNR